MIRRFLKSVYHIIGASSQHPVNIDCSNKLTSPANAVESSDDLLIEILLRLPVNSILVFKSVSKRWYSIITDPKFTLHHRSTIPKLDPASGLYIEQPGSYSVYDFVPLDTRIQVIKSSPSNIILRYYHRKVIILQSCHGLLLCRGAYMYHNDYNYYVYNPTTNMFKDLPPCPISNGNMRMAYDPTKSPHYKLVYARSVAYN
ncbi:F-box protein At5g07610-like [Rutidosis leptorrhynchoides]|uniref:F-box protein At5g07610-like n=1 Tax=Rutidosis leptorrhynchoides TaxID=125765 RepID=UPI003A9968A7